MKKKILACDIDGVIINSNHYWFQELQMITKKNIQYSDIEYSYDLTPHFQPELSDKGYTGFEWWKQKNIYYDMEPMQGAVDVLTKLSEYVDIFFVSVILGSHGGSKFDFVMEHFPFTKAVLFTKEKGCVKHDYAIDDRVENINRFDDKAKKILFQNSCEQTSELKAPNVKIAKNWEDVDKHMSRWLKIPCEVKKC